MYKQKLNYLFKYKDSRKIRFYEAYLDAIFIFAVYKYVNDSIGYILAIILLLTYLGNGIAIGKIDDQIEDELSRLK